MRILLIGQTSLHWGRMEFGNIAPHIIEPFVRQLHKIFPNAVIKTTLQMSDRFCKSENIKVLPLDMYYGWEQDNLPIAMKELEIAKEFNSTGFLSKSTPFIDEAKSDLVIDFSGDIWGDNANFLGEDRFYIGLIKNRIAQLFNKKTAMLAGSPGPFNNVETVDFAKEVYSSFDLVTNRESISANILSDLGFDISKTKSLAHVQHFCLNHCLHRAKDLKIETIINPISKPIIGFVLCGWNFTEGPYDKWPRDDSEFNIFTSAVEHISEELDCHVLLLSHSNGFVPNKTPFELIHGRDYLVSEQLNKILKERGVAKNYSLVTDVLDAWETKALIGEFDMLVSGRIHGAVAGLSQEIPTVIIDYGHEPKAQNLEDLLLKLV